MAAVVGPGEGVLHGCVGQSGALNCLEGVVGGGGMERFQQDYHDNYRPYYGRTQALPTNYGSHWGTSPWVTSDSATTISHSSSSVASTWRPAV